ncbi:hypothetical protein CLV92_102318 [Kineococcus xinjiangensis]|uniref:Uncharacterized protein n=1 Tax=Kineococcus xinjiangensis TaxID=512762 RepID=A0A2S6IV59_9ACTN|nr:hypothetical protein [Kineococcus xinjiangensis]PPK98165.1 hypothetical protein CLV92_102318 [Kineococcus xinjiangensis]
MREGGAAREPARAWSDRDSALWHTCEIAADLAAGAVPQPRLDIATPFPPRFAADERFWAAGPFDLLALRAPEGAPPRGAPRFFLATGAGGLAATAAVALARAAGDARRRAEEERRAAPRWVRVDAGALAVSGCGMYWHTPAALLTWDWGSVTSAEVLEPGAVHLTGEGPAGPGSWILRSDWAELVFVTWALQRHPRHPQLRSGGWLPPGWLSWCATQPYPTRLASAALPPAGTRQVGGHPH